MSSLTVSYTHLDIRLTENEYEMIVEKAAECGLTLSNYGRKLLHTHHPNKRLSDEEVQGLNSLSDARADLTMTADNLSYSTIESIYGDLSITCPYSDFGPNGIESIGEVTSILKKIYCLFPKQRDG